MRNVPSITMTAGAGLALLAVGLAADACGGLGLGSAAATYAIKGLALGAGGAAGNAVWDSLKAGASVASKRLAGPEQRLANHDLQALAGRAIAVVAAAAAKECPGGANGRAYLARIAKRFPDAWSQATLDARYNEVLDKEIPKFFGKADGTRPKTTSLSVRLWQDLVGSLAGTEVDADEQAALTHVATRLHEQFPRALFELAKEDFSPESTGSPHDGKAFAALLLSLIRDTMGGIGEVLKKQDEAIKGNAEILAELTKLNQSLAARGADVARLSPKDIAAIVTPIKAEIDKLAASLANAIGRLYNSLSDLHTKVDTANKSLEDIKGTLKGRLRPDSPPSTVPTPSPTFVPRKNITAKIHAALQANPEQVVVRQAVTRAMGGYGKTVAAILYAHEYAAEYPGGRFFLPIESGDIVAALASLITPLGLTSANDPKADAALVSATLKDGEPSLLILDNVATKGAWTAMLDTGLVPRGNCRVLITTRDDRVAEKHDIAIGRLEPDEAREVYRLFCETRKTGAGHAPALPPAHVADAITAWVGGLAVAVAAVAAFMKLNPDISWEEHWLGDGKGMVGLKNMPDIELPDVLPEVAAQLGLEGKALADHRRTLRVIDDAINSLPAPERRAVDYAALLPADMAPAIWLETLLEGDAARPGPASGEAADPLHLTLTKKPFSKASPARAVLEHLDALDILLPGGEGGKLLSLHRLWHARLNEPPHGAAADRGALLLSLAACAAARRADVLGVDEPGKPAAIDNPHVVTNAALRWELSPLISVAVALAQAGRLKEAETVAWWLPIPLRLLGRLAEARAVLESLLKNPAAAQAALGDSDFASLLTNLALIQKDQGDLPGARASIERAIAIEQKHFAPDHPTFATRYSNLAIIQQDQGDLPGARASMERAIAIDQKHFAPDHPTLATSYNNLAGILRELKQLPDARRYADKAVRIDTLHHGPASPILSFSLSGLAKVQRDQGDFDAARATMQRVFAIDTGHFEPTNVTWGYNHQNMGELELAAGNTSKACESFQAALPILLNHLGDAHHRVQKLRASMQDAGCGG
ncbi:MAG: tetratricopeptide repeat protein [Phycisphaerales bacterium]|nr:tetratricopeptide repeat protein [Phycisphaerales bacterium]